MASLFWDVPNDIEHFDKCRHWRCVTKRWGRISPCRDWCQRTSKWSTANRNWRMKRKGHYITTLIAWQSMEHAWYHFINIEKSILVVKLQPYLANKSPTGRRHALHDKSSNWHKLWWVGSSALVASFDGFTCPSSPPLAGPGPCDEGRKKIHHFLGHFFFVFSIRCLHKQSLCISNSCQINIVCLLDARNSPGKESSLAIFHYAEEFLATLSATIKFIRRELQGILVID